MALSMQQAMALVRLDEVYPAAVPASQIDGRTLNSLRQKKLCSWTGGSKTKVRINEAGRLVIRSA